VPPQIEAANQGFRSAYAQAKKDILARIGPVIVAAGADVHLIKDGKRESKNTIIPEYTVLKTVDHIPLGLFVILENHAGKPLSQEVRRSVQSMQTLTKAAMPTIDRVGLPDSTKERLRKMLEESLRFEESVLFDNGFSRADLDAFIGRVREATMQNVDDAVALELGALDAAVQQWRKQLTVDQWKNLYVVVASAHMPRESERRMQYFGELLGETREGHRLIYQEGSEDVDRALDLLAIHVLDESISREYFNGDSWSMHRDLLAAAA
jgi:hypothetical protein